MNKQLYPILLIFLCLFSTELSSQNILRGPYLQSVSQEKINIRWRTDVPTSSKVWFGLTPDNLTESVTDSGVRTEHELSLTNLIPNTRYYYTIGTETAQLVNPSSEHYFKTSPKSLVGEPISVWVLGDAGRKNANQRAVRDAFYNYNNNEPVDLLLTLGDNAYSDGTDSEFQDAWFENMYEDRLINISMFQTYGNHDGESADGEDGTGVYFDIFTMPTDGSSGGVPSGNESFYSFDYGDAHFISLNTWDVDRSPDSDMVQWLAADLAANDKTWTIVTFHHPVYDGRYDIDSDTKSLNTEMRESVVPLFDQYGVDLVLMGHSHTYQRSYLIDGHYDKSPTFDPSTMGIDMGDGQIDGDGPYQKVDGKGIVYVVSGTAGSVNSVDNLDHPVMYHNALTRGSFILEIDHDQLDAKFLTEDGLVDDYFTIVKDIPPVQLVHITNPLQGFTAPQNAIVTTSVSENISAISEISFFVNETLIGTDNVFPFTMDCIFPTNGSYDIEILATTSFGNYRDSVHIVIGDQSYPDDSDGDGTLDQDDLCEGSLEPGTICNDENTATYDDVIDENCNCIGTPYDCSALQTDIGTPCDDNNPATYDDVINGNCECMGIPFDCPTSLADFGTPCNDNNADTYGETLDENCNCVPLPLNDITSVTAKLVAESDDAEEAADGNIDLNSSDLEMVQEDTKQIIGLRYTLANIPTNAQILESYIQFEVDEIDTSPTTLTIYGELNNNAPTFNNTDGNISDRTKTTNFVTWSVDPWLTIEAAGLAQRSVDISSILQEIITQPAYTTSTPIVLIIEGVGKRVAISSDKSLHDGPELNFTYGFLCPDADADGICDQDDQCPDSPGSVGEPCDDGNDATVNDTYNTSCECIGTPFDCPSLMVDIGTTCDDNNLATYNDVVTLDCNCEGTLFDCSILMANVGATCNDNNSNTTNDVVTSDCECLGSPIVGTITTSTKVNSSSDDAEEKSNGSVSLSSTDLELVQENSAQTIGIRFVDTGVPANANIMSAYIQFTVDEVQNHTPTILNIYGEANDNPLTFENNTGNITNRLRTSTSVIWEPELWSAVGMSDTKQRTTDISALVSTLVSQTGYTPANAMVFIIDGQGKRVAESYNGSSSAAPELVVTYSIGAITYDCPQLELNFGASCDDNNAYTINDIVTSDCECIGTAGYDCPQLELNFGASCDDNNAYTVNDIVTSDCECIGTIVYDCPQLELNFGASCDDNNASTINDIITTDCECIGTASYDCPQLELNFGASCDDNNPTTINDMVQQDCSCSGVVPAGFACAKINSTADDAEEKSNGNVNLTSSDLELVKSSSDQIIGLRFKELNIPPGVIIGSAAIQFTVDEAKNENPCELTIYGELHNNPGPFTTNNGNISGRIKTDTYLSWMPEEWPTVNEAGSNQQTVDIAPILQEIIDQPGYTVGSAIVIIIEGSGTRTAESYDGDEDGAAELCVEYELSNINSASAYQETEETITAPVDASKTSLHVFPNPAKDYLTLRFDPRNHDKEAIIQIWDANGRLVHNEKRIIPAWENEWRLAALNLPNGNYTVQLYRNPFLKAAKFVVLQ